MPSTTEIHFPPARYGLKLVHGLTPWETDEMLENGWFRTNVQAFTAAVKHTGNHGWRSCLMLRTRLEGFEFKKRHRKLLRQNGEKFTVVFRPFHHTEEMERLWQWFKIGVHQWAQVTPLDQHLLGGVPPTDFNTWEVCVYHENNLVAFSVFDRGRRAMASLEAAYDPAYANHSLGFYTMLLEIEFGIQHGMTHYYPGFLPKDIPMFEYKLRTGNVEFFRLSEQRWVDWEQVQTSDWLFEATARHLHFVKRRLEENKTPVRFCATFHEHDPTVDPLPAGFNLFLVAPCGNQERPLRYQHLGWDPLTGQYHLSEIVFVSDLALDFSRTDSNWLVLPEIHSYIFVGSFQEGGEVALVMLEKAQRWKGGF